MKERDAYSAYVRDDERQDYWLERTREARDEDSGCGPEEDRRQFGY